MRCLTMAFVLLAGSAGVGQAQEKSGDWLQFRGPGGQGISAAKGLPLTWSQQENLAWKTRLPGAGGSSPIVVGNRIYLTCFTGYGVPGQGGGSMEDLRLHLLCLDRQKGDILWTKQVTPKLPESRSTREGHGYASSTPASDGERIYVFFGKSGVHAFDLNGTPLWQADVGSRTHEWGSAASPIVYEDLVLVNASVESDSLVALDKRKGTEKWRASGIREAWNTPIVVEAGGRKEVVVAILGKILGFDPANGAPLWSCRTDIGWYMVPTLATRQDEILCIGGRSGGALAVRAGGKGDVTATHRFWTGKKGSNVPSPVYHDGHLYWMHEVLGVAYCADAKSGRIVYEERIDRAGQVYASALLADGKIYYLTRTGTTFVLPARPEFQVLATNNLGDRSTFNSSPVAVGSQLLIRSDTYLYCVAKK